MDAHLRRLLALQVFAIKNSMGQYCSPLALVIIRVTVTIVVVVLSERQGKQTWKPIVKRLRQLHVT